ncbi:MAG: tyrosine-type recombinase/integrase [Phycisphaerales bacterium]|nr:tyrosine-type recombinase/integrase [Phycisphaerales bacterium]MCB9855292.1 tyrosine-type recombinase/integrase [Phycisphaerales bacterium]MCB9862885.1 tyrosine-type recombinase/integrase [Phycisphaerales bacterium]
MATIFRKDDKQIWWITYYHKGKRYRYSLRTTDQRIALKKLKKLEGEIVTDELETRTRTPIAPFLEAFAGHLTATRTTKSYKNDISYLRIFFGPICQALVPKTTRNRRFGPGENSVPKDRFKGRHVVVQLLEDLTPNAIGTFINARITRDGVAPKTANRMREVLHVMFNYAIRQHGFRASDKRYPNPVDAVPRLREEQHVIRFLTLDQIDQQLHALVDKPLLRVMVATLIYSGLRREELLWLTNEDVDLENHMIRVCKKTVAGETWWPKTRRNRRVPMSSVLQGFLNAHRPHRKAPWFFSTPSGCRWHPDNFSGTLREVNRAQGFPWGCLDFRHTFGSHLAMKGESLFKISELMGNSPEICRRHYAALMPEEMRDTVEFDSRPRRGDLILRNEECA